MNGVQALAEFLAESFTTDELRLWCSMTVPQILVALPDPPANVLNVSLAVVGWLGRRGLLNAGTFAALREARPRRAAEIEALQQSLDVPPELETPWLADLWARLTASTGGQRDHVDRSLDGARRRCALADRVLRARAALTAHEWEVFVAAIVADACVELAARDEAAIREAIREVPGVAPMAALVARVVVGIRDGVRPSDGQHGETELRLGLVVALARLTTALACTRRFLSNGAQRPPDDADVGWWSMYLAQDWVQVTPGIVRLVLSIYDRKWLEPLGGATALAVRVAWEELQRVLTDAGVSLTLAACEGRLSSEPEPPSTVLAGLRRSRRDNLRRWPKVAHYGRPLDVDAVLRQPLPSSVYRGDVCFDLRGDPPRRVVLIARGDERARFCLDGAGRKTISAAELVPGAVYDWWIERDDGFGEMTPVTRGELSVARAGLDLDDSPPTLANRHLWTELVQTWWPRRAALAQEDLWSLYAAFRGAYQRLREHDPESEYRDMYMDAMDTTLALLQPLDGEEQDGI